MSRKAPEPFLRDNNYKNKSDEYLFDLENEVSSIKNVERDQEQERDIFDEDEGINQEHSHMEDENISKSKSINADDIIVEEKKDLETKETLPRFAIGHKLKSKTLENSVMEDYLCYEVVDSKGCEEFRSHTYIYINQKLLDKGVKLSDSMIANMRSAILNKIDKIHNEEFNYIKELMENSLNVPRKKKGCNLLCQKPKPKQHLTVKSDMKPLVSEMRKSFMSFKKNLSNCLSSDEKIESFFSAEKLNLEIEKILNKKTEFLFEVQKMKDKLKDEVDKYWEYFNIRKILSKQSHKIKALKNKLTALEDAHTQNDCIICMENERNVIFYPCLHMICCEICGLGKICADCPQCHTKIENKQITLS